MSRGVPLLRRSSEPPALSALLPARRGRNQRNQTPKPEARNPKQTKNPNVRNARADVWVAGVVAPCCGEGVSGRFGGLADLAGPEAAIVTSGSGESKTGLHGRADTNIQYHHERWRGIPLCLCPTVFFGVAA